MDAGIAKKFIIVADDNKLIATVLSNKLTQAGYEALVAHDGDEALRAIANKKPDLLILDLIMPVKDGFNTLQELRANPTTQDVRVIVTSELQQPEDMQRVQQLGVLEVFDKGNLQGIVNRVSEFFAS
jgi:CheY-like chemotaxis protein